MPLDDIDDDEPHYDEDGTCLECGATEDEYHDPTCPYVGDDDEEEDEDELDEESEELDDVEEDDDEGLDEEDEE